MPDAASVAKAPLTVAARAAMAMVAGMQAIAKARRKPKGFFDFGLTASFMAA